MKLLIIGGTVFLGRALVQAALQHNHEITLFNRGQTNPNLFPRIEQLHGDRSVKLTPLQGRYWDAVIDTCGYVPRVVGMSAETLADAVGLYTFISSLSVYADFTQPGVDENSAVATIEAESIEEVNGETYGPLKALSEQAAEKAMPGRMLIIRPGLIVGPYDPTDRFTYWPHRVAQGGEVLAPGRAKRQIRFTDVRDLAEWTVRMIEAGKIGIFNADGPTPPVTMGELLSISRQVSGSDAAITWVKDSFLVEQNVGPWMELPLWLPESDPETAGFFATDNRKALAAGLTFRPVTETVEATLAWDAARPPDHPWLAGLAAARERELFDAWKQVTAS